MKPARQRIPTVVLSACFCLSTACQEDKPYTPFEVATALPEVENAPSSASSPGTVEPENRTSAYRRAPPASQKWKQFGVEFVAPAGNEIQGAMATVMDSSTHYVAWLTPRQGNNQSESSGLWLMTEAGHPQKRLVTYPEFLPRGSDCQFDTSIEQTGPLSLTARLRSNCRSRLLPGTPVELLSVIQPQATDPSLLQLRLLAPAPGERLSYAVDSHDRDSDGKDDIKLDITLTSPEKAQVTLPFLWLTRTAGASQLPEAPRKQLASMAARWAVSAVRKAERGKVPSQVRAGLRLLGSMCSEYGVSRVLRQNGDPIACGDVWPSIAKLQHSHVVALLGDGQLAQALGTAHRSDWLGHKPTEREDKALRLALSSKIEHPTVKQIARFSTATESLETAFASPLRFSADGQLWARVRGGETKRLTLRGDPPLVSPAQDGKPGQRITPPSWSLSPHGPGGRQLTAAVPSCQRSEMQLTFSMADGTPADALPIQLLAPRPGNCRGAAVPSTEAIPLFWRGGQLLLVVGGEPLWSAGEQGKIPGAIAWGTRFGVAVMKDEQLRLWTGELTKSMHHCASDGEAQRVACLKNESVYVLEAASAAPKTSEGREDEGGRSTPP